MGAAEGRQPLYLYPNVVCLCIKWLPGFTSCAFALAFGGGAHYCYLDAIPGSRVGVGWAGTGTVSLPGLYVFQWPKMLKRYLFQCATDSQRGAEKLRVGRKDRIVQIAAPPSW